MFAGLRSVPPVQLSRAVLGRQCLPVDHAVLSRAEAVLDARSMHLQSHGPAFDLGLVQAHLERTLP